MDISELILHEVELKSLKLGKTIFIDFNQRDEIPAVALLKDDKGRAFRQVARTNREMIQYSGPEIISVPYRTVEVYIH